MKNFKGLQKELALRVSLRKLRERRLLEDGVAVSHPPQREIRFANGSRIVFIPPKTMKAYRKYRLNGGRDVFVETLLEMS